MMKQIKISTKKTYIRTLLMLLLSLLVAAGGWYVTKQLLEYKGTQLLAKSGQLDIADSGYSLQPDSTDPGNTENTGKPGNTEDTGEPGIFHGKPVSEDMMAKILDCWASDNSLLSHDPQKGQMNMVQAITAGQGWITDLAQKGFLPSYLSGHNFRDVNAILYTLEEKPDIPDHLLSRWIISYTMEDIRIMLSIHAVTGQVWQAEIITHNGILPEYSSDEELLKAAFPFLGNGGSEYTADIESGTYQIRILSSGQKICGKVQRSQYEMNDNNRQDSFSITTLMLGTVSK